jgi:hypothetical protein
VKKCVVLQVNDAAVSLRLVIYGSRAQLFLFVDYRTDWRGEGGLAVLADGHLVRGPNRILGGAAHIRSKLLASQLFDAKINENHVFRNFFH